MHFGSCSEDAAVFAPFWCIWATMASEGRPAAVDADAVELQLVCLSRKAFPKVYTTFPELLGCSSSVAFFEGAIGE